MKDPVFDRNLGAGNPFRSRTLGEEHTHSNLLEDHPVYQSYEDFAEEMNGKNEIIMIAPGFSTVEENDKFLENWRVADHFLSGEIKLVRR